MAGGYLPLRLTNTKYKELSLKNFKECGLSYDDTILLFRHIKSLETKIRRLEKKHKGDS